MSALYGLLIGSCLARLGGSAALVFRNDNVLALPGSEELALVLGPVCFVGVRERSSGQGS